MSAENDPNQPEDLQYLSATIGQRLRYFRETQHLEAAQLTEYMDIPIEMIAEIEQGKLPLSIEWLRKLSERLGLNPTWLLTGSEHMMKQTSLECHDLLKHMQIPVVAETILADLPLCKIIFDHHRETCGRKKDKR